jgi:hypothetical protein
MKRVKYTIKVGSWVLRLCRSQYRDGGGIALKLVEDLTGEPFLFLTINLIGCSDIEPGEFAIKDYSENEPYINDIFASGLFEDTGKRIGTGFVRSPVWRFAPGVRP